MNFACELMDLCRGTQEVEAVISEGTGCGEGIQRDPLARLKMAIRYEEKKVSTRFKYTSVSFLFLKFPKISHI